MTQTQEAPATDEAVEAKVEETKPVSAPPARDEELAAFVGLIEKITAGDTELPLDEAGVASYVEAYGKIHGNRKAISTAKSAMTDAMQSAVTAGEIDQARAILEIQRGCEQSTPARSSAPKAPVDPMPGFVASYAAHMLAAQLILNLPPEGVDVQTASTKADTVIDDSQNEVMKYLEWVASTAEDKGDQPEVSDVVQVAIKLSQGKAAKTRTPKAPGTSAPRAVYEGPRRSIGKHIAQVFALPENAGVDFLSVSEIAKTKSDEYGDDKVSSGAIAAKIDSSLRAEPTPAEILEGTGLVGTLEPRKGVKRSA